MAITPRTILSQPLNLLLFALSILVLGGLLGVLAGVSNLDQRQSDQWQSEQGQPDLGQDGRYIPPDMQARQDAGVFSWGDNESDSERAGSDDAMVVGTESDYRDHTCRLEDPAPSWSEGQWLRHLGCMEARGEPSEVILDETSAAIDSVGLTPELAVEKADWLKVVETPDEHIAFLDAAVTRLGVSDGELVHRLARALTWRGEADDIERIRHLQLLSRMLLPESCEVQQTDIWVRYALAERIAEAPSPAAWHGVRHGIASYVADDCHLRRDRGEPDALAEMLGVGVVAEATNGHTGQSSLIRQVAETEESGGEIGQVRALCREAVPAGTGLRSECEKRLGDELFLAR